MENQVTSKFLEDVHQLRRVSVTGPMPQKSNSWKADLLLGELIIEGAAPSHKDVAAEAVSALQMLIGFASQKLPVRA